MKPNKTYLKGKSVFIVSLLVIIATALTVYVTGINFHRSITSNFYISLGIIAATLFLFLTYGLYKGVRIADNFPKLKDFKIREWFRNGNGTVGDVPDIGIDVSDGIGGAIISVILWMLMSIVLVFLLVVLETIFWFSLFMILVMLYWVFFRAMRLVFSKAHHTQNDLGWSTVYALGYTFLYIGWIFGIVYATTVFK